jgi:hypothetical protein
MVGWRFGLIPNSLGCASAAWSEAEQTMSNAKSTKSTAAVRAAVMQVSSDANELLSRRANSGFA